MDTADGMQRDFVLSDALAVCYHLPYYLQSKRKAKKWTLAAILIPTFAGILCCALFAQITNFVLR
mgnify:CR=1 FL=1